MVMQIASEGLAKMRVCMKATTHHYALQALMDYTKGIRYDGDATKVALVNENCCKV